jgi:hypothetical protein
MQLFRKRKGKEKLAQNKQQNPCCFVKYIFYLATFPLKNYQNEA